MESRFSVNRLAINIITLIPTIPINTKNPLNHIKPSTPVQNTPIAAHGKGLKIILNGLKLPSADFAHTPTQNKAKPIIPDQKAMSTDPE